jgi:threonine aldolase
MRRAMADADVGDDGYGEDPTVNRLQELAAAATGQAAALYVPSGTMANQLALRLLARAGTEVICAARAHVYRYEAAAAGRNAAVQLRALDDRDGLLHADAIVRAFADRAHHLPPISLVCIENTHMPANGRPWTRDDVVAVSDVVRADGLSVHCDGARIFNAAVALETTAKNIASHADSVSFCLSKGLACPVGSLLCGSSEFVGRARRMRKMLGGGMRQAGVFAAAGIVALESMIDRLAEDHQNARALAQGLGLVAGLNVRPVKRRTNMVMFEVDGGAEAGAKFAAAMKERGVIAHARAPSSFRAVTHHGISRRDIDLVVAAAAEAAGEVFGD